MHSLDPFLSLNLCTVSLDSRSPPEISLDSVSHNVKNGTRFRKYWLETFLTARQALDHRLSGSSTALGMARTFKALRQRSAFFLPTPCARSFGITMTLDLYTADRVIRMASYFSKYCTVLLLFSTL